MSHCTRCGQTLGGGSQTLHPAPCTGHTPRTRNILVRACGCEYDGRGWFQECSIHAAALDLLAALEAMIAECRYKGPFDSLPAARTAIAKAKGESNG